MIVIFRSPFCIPPIGCDTVMSSVPPEAFPVGVLFFYKWVSRWVSLHHPEP